MTNTSRFDFNSLHSTLPPLIWRSRWDEHRDKCGLPYARGTMENLDSQGRGPAKVMFGKRVAYEREALILWLNGISARGTAHE